MRRAPFIRPPASRPPRATLALPSLPRTAQPARAWQFCWGDLLVIVILIVIFIRWSPGVGRIFDRLLMHAIRRGAADQAHQHRDDRHQHLFPLFGANQPLLGHKHIQTRRTFQCEATGNVKEPASIRGRTLAVSLRYVQGDRRRDPVQLVICRQTFWKCFQEASSPSHKSNRLLINARFLVIEVRFHGCCLLWRKPSTHAQDEDRARWGLGLGLGDIGTCRTAMRPRLPFRG